MRIDCLASVSASASASASAAVAAGECLSSSALVDS